MGDSGEKPENAGGVDTNSGSLLDLEPLVNGDWLSWLASKSKLKDIVEPTEEETREEYEYFLKHTNGGSDILYYEEYDEVTNNDEIDIIEDDHYDNLIYTQEQDRKPFLLSDLNTRDILYHDIVEFNASTPHYVTAQISSTVQPLYSTDVTTKHTVVTTPGNKYSEVVDQNNKLVDILKSTLEMQAFLMDKLVAFFIK